VRFRGEERIKSKKDYNNIIYYIYIIYYIKYLSTFPKLLEKVKNAKAQKTHMRNSGGCRIKILS
jgi:hypothetical protein